MIFHLVYHYATRSTGVFYGFFLGVVRNLNDTIMVYIESFSYNMQICKYRPTLWQLLQLQIYAKQLWHAKNVLKLLEYPDVSGLKMKAPTLESAETENTDSAFS